MNSFEGPFFKGSTLTYRTKTALELLQSCFFLQVRMMSANVSPP